MVHGAEVHGAWCERCMVRMSRGGRTGEGGEKGEKKQGKPISWGPHVEM